MKTFFKTFDFSIAMFTTQLLLLVIGGGAYIAFLCTLHIFSCLLFIFLSVGGWLVLYLFFFRLRNHGKILLLLLVFATSNVNAQTVSKIEFETAATLTAVDAAQTCHNLHNGGHEFMLPTQSCAGVTAILGGELAAQEFTARKLEQHNHKKLAFAVRLITIQANIRGIDFSSKH